MAINETIITGKKFRRCMDATNKIWQKISFWHKACDCEFDDGTDAQSKLGAIKGITTDLNVTTTGYAADMMAVKQLEIEINKLSDNLSSIDAVDCTYDTFGNITGTKTITVKKDEANVNFNTLIIFISEDRRYENKLNTFTVSDATLIKTITGSKYYNHTDQEYRLYDIPGDSFTLNINFGNTNSGISYLVLDKKVTDMNICSDIINYDDAYKNSLFVSCNMSDNRGQTFIENDSKKYVVHKQSSRKGINFDQYFENMFIVFNILKDGYVSINRTMTNQFGVILRLE